MTKKVFDIIEPPQFSRRAATLPKPVSAVAKPVSIQPDNEVVDLHRDSPEMVIPSKPSLDSLFSKEMSRKEFLLTIGIGLTSLLGLSSAISVFGDKQGQVQLAQNSYSSGPYGGYKQT